MKLGLIDCDWREGVRVPPSLSKAEVTEILSFVYESYYHAHFGDHDIHPVRGYSEAEIRRFHQRLHELKAETVSALGDEVGLIDPRHQNGRSASRGVKERSR